MVERESPMSHDEAVRWSKLVRLLRQLSVTHMIVVVQVPSRMEGPDEYRISLMDGEAFHGSNC